MVTKVKSCPLDTVRMNDAYQINAFGKELAYLKSFDLGRLTAGFYETRGLVPDGDKYEGWESTEIRGHTLGHYLTAVSQAYCATKDTALYQILMELIDRLAVCQWEDGYLSAFEPEYFTRVEQKKPVWVPWYTMHKLISGLVSVYHVTSLQKAYHLLDKLADWVSRRVLAWQPEMQETVLAVEYGGMNDCLYDTYLITNKREHFDAAHMFDEVPLFEALARGEDILNNHHANTMIPKFVGAMKRVMVTGKKDMFFAACINFWDIVINHHTYITGGNSEWEHFGKADVLDAERTNCNCETCNIYNMLKLTKGLFELTGERKYLDFYERAFINTILSSQNPNTGMTMYFQPMATGYFKVYGTPFDKFWCCTGSGMENFTKLGDGIYYENENQIYIGRYVSSTFLQGDSHIKTGCVLQENAMEVDLNIVNLRKALHCIIPSWCQGIPLVTFGDIALQYQIQDGFLVFPKTQQTTFSQSIQVHITLPMKVEAKPLQDTDFAVAFQYGPFVLSAKLGTDNMETSHTGVNVTIPMKNIAIDDSLIIQKRDVWLANLKNNLIKEPNEMCFKLHNASRSLTFIPHYMQHSERYGIYWHLLEEGSNELQAYKETQRQKELFERMIIDTIPLGNDQYELEHNITGEHSSGGTADGYRFREAAPRGWFAYLMGVDPTNDNELCFFHADVFTGAYEIWCEDQLIKKIEWDTSKYLSYSLTTITIPLALTFGKNKISIRFVNLRNHPLRISDILYTKRKQSK